MYNNSVLEHFLNPHNVGRLPDADGTGMIGDPDCGDYLKIYIKVRDEKLIDVKFEIFGCPAAIATASILTDLAKGKSVEEALKISDLDVIKALGGLPDRKIHCSSLGAEALHKAIEDYLAKKEFRPSLKQDGENLGERNVRNLQP
ncbi:iron-sulfur cluster assembly scaffold protein [Thermanaeromonas sp. C210]|uniref:iron-sulfur cluster assembly scaffold protein n=1 Tax=Thermanaeromonas sp. C210 TaxID=2731925 RepID=UPI00155BC507|nr:iron-sulfur cluster assembly scaffold protein [Thermanaeromonas sp. C210]GFN22803.1 iron-sulfur cluster assembly scaffold protein [Thermanaeromonas sp. C210]